MPESRKARSSPLFANLRPTRSEVFVLNRPAVIQAAYYAVLAIGDEPSRRNVVGMVKRITGKGIRFETVHAWMTERETLGKQSVTAPETPIVRKIAHLGNATETVGNPSRARHKVLDSEDNKQASPAAAARQLPLVDADEVRAREALAALWPLVSPALGRSTTQTAWKAKNKRVVLDMVRAGSSLAEIVAAHGNASRRIGGTVYSLRVVQDQLAKDAATSAADDRPRFSGEVPDDDDWAGSPLMAEHA
jgi:hypothetical protein